MNVKSARLLLQWPDMLGAMTFAHPIMMYSVTAGYAGGLYNTLPTSDTPVLLGVYAGHHGHKPTAQFLLLFTRDGCAETLADPT